MSCDSQKPAKPAPTDAAPSPSVPPAPSPGPGPAPARDVPPPVQACPDCLQLALSVVVNAFGDRLPLIPTASRVSQRQVLYHLELEARVTANGQPTAGTPVSLTSSRTADTITPASTNTDAQGIAKFTVETRSPGNAIFTAHAQGATGALSYDFLEAWYESGFYITAYNVCDEQDFTGELIPATGLAENHRRDFLLGGRGVAMQGTGLGSNGRYIRLANAPGELRWRPRHAGIENEADARFAYSDVPQGAYNPVVEGTSIAVDPHVIPRRHRVHIQSANGGRVVGERRADDTGGAIDDYHIDVFMGAGEAAIQRWQAAGGNLNGARVKYLGP